MAEPQAARASPRRGPGWLGRLLRTILLAILVAFLVGFGIGTLLRREIDRPVRYFGVRETPAPGTTQPWVRPTQATSWIPCRAFSCRATTKSASESRFR